MATCLGQAAALAIAVPYLQRLHFGKALLQGVALLGILSHAVRLAALRVRNWVHSSVPISLEMVAAPIVREQPTIACCIRDSIIRCSSAGRGFLSALRRLPLMGHGSAHVSHGLLMTSLRGKGVRLPYRVDSLCFWIGCKDLPSVALG